MPSYVLTGAPGAGKTAILRLLEASRHPVVEEAATDVIALGRAPSRYLGFITSRPLDDEVRLASATSSTGGSSPASTPPADRRS
jgi:hypothetical protein